MRLDSSTRFIICLCCGKVTMFHILACLGYHGLGGSTFIVGCAQGRIILKKHFFKLYKILTLMRSINFLHTHWVKAVGESDLVNKYMCACTQTHTHLPVCQQAQILLHFCFSHGLRHLCPMYLVDLWENSCWVTFWWVTSLKSNNLLCLRHLSTYICHNLLTLIKLYGFPILLSWLLFCLGKWA